MKTIDEIYAAINPIPAMLSAKGKAEPKVTIEFEANSGIVVWIRWRKEYKPQYHGELESNCFIGEKAEDVITKTLSFVERMLSAEEAKLHDFMRDLGHLIDAGNKSGIKVDYLNPLTETMKRISENAITYHPNDDDDFPF